MESLLSIRVYLIKYSIGIFGKNFFWFSDTVFQYILKVLGIC